MKKGFVFLFILPLILLLGCDNLGNKTEREITETFGDRTCIGRGIDKIEGYAECTSLSGGTYKGDVRGHNLNGKGELFNSSGAILEGYFYNGYMVAGKATKSNGDEYKGLWKILGANTISLELGKSFKKNGNIDLGEFNDKGEITYGLSYGINGGYEKYVVGKFPGDLKRTDGYFVMPIGCAKCLNGECKEITRTITNTVYGNNNKISAPKNILYQELGSATNPYRVNLTIE